MAPITGTTISALKGRPVTASMGGIAMALILLGVLADLGNTEPGLSGMGIFGASILSAPFGLTAILGAMGTAKPDSWWWRRRHSPGKQEALSAIHHQGKAPRG